MARASWASRCWGCRSVLAGGVLGTVRSSSSHELVGKARGVRRAKSASRSGVVVLCWAVPRGRRRAQMTTVGRCPWSAAQARTVPSCHSRGRMTAAVSRVSSAVGEQAAVGCRVEVCGATGTEPGRGGWRAFVGARNPPVMPERSHSTAPWDTGTSNRTFWSPGQTASVSFLPVPGPPQGALWAPTRRRAPSSSVRSKPTMRS